MTHDDDLVLPPDSLPLEQARRLDLICDRFEAAWQAGTQPAIQAALVDVLPGDRLAVLRELVILDATYRRRLGELATAADYAARYPELDAHWLANALATSAPTQVLPTPQGSSAPHDDPTIDSQPDSPSGSFPQLVRYFGDYELLAEIARGGMGVVYKARQVSLNRIVAVKTILAGKIASPAEVERFHKEAEAAARLDHPHIVPVYEVDLHENQHYFSMGFVDGRGLDAVASENLLEPREAARIMALVAEAVQYAHDRGVIHRDLKPSNILLDGAGNPRVTDFGLAKQVDDQSGITMTGQILGTPSYMPPEQAAGQIDLIGPHSDVYSLGAVLYALLTGRPPFKSASTVQTLRQVLEKDPLPPRELNPTIPLDLATISLKCLEKSVSRRYPTARAVADELRRYLEGRPIEARPITQFERGWRWCKHNPVVASLSALAIGLLLAISIGASVAYRREAQQLSRETAHKNAAIAGEKREAGLRRDAEAEKRNALAAEQKATTAKFAAQAAEQREREQRLNAERQTRQAQMHRLAIQSQSLIKEYPDRGLLLATEAVTLAKAHGDPVPRQVEQILRTALALASDNRVGGAAGAVPGTLSHADISPDNRWLAFAMKKDPASSPATKKELRPDEFLEVHLFDLRHWGEERSPLILKRPSKAAFGNMSADLRFSFDGRWLISTDHWGQRYAWDMRADAIADSLQEIAGQTMPSEGDKWRSPSGRWGLTLVNAMDGKKSLSLLDFTTDKPGTPVETLTTDAHYSGFVYPAIFSPQDRFCACSEAGAGHETDLLLYQLDADPNVERKRFLPGGERTKQKILGFSPDERWLLVVAETMSEAKWGAFKARSPNAFVGEPSALKLVLWPTWPQSAAASGVVLLDRGDQKSATSLWDFSSDGRWLFLVVAGPPAGARLAEPSPERPFPHWLRADGQPMAAGDLVREILRFDLAESDIAASKRIVARIPSVARCLLSAVDGSWVAVGGDDQLVHVWKSDQPTADKPWRSLMGNNAVVTHLYRTPKQQLISRSFVPKNDQDANGQCLLWDLASENERPVLEFKGYPQFITNAPARSTDCRWWVSAEYNQNALLDMSSLDPSGRPIRFRYGDSDVSQPTFGGGEFLTRVRKHNTTAVLRDEWLLIHSRWQAEDSSPLYLYHLGGRPRPLDPWLATDKEDPIKDRTQQEIKVSPDGRWIARMEVGHDSSSHDVLRLSLNGYEPSAEHVIELPLARGSGGRPPQLVFSPHGEYLACVFRNGTRPNLRVWRLTDQTAPQLILSQDGFPDGSPFSSLSDELAFSADERWLALGAGDMSVRLFDLAADDIAHSVQRLIPKEAGVFQGQIRGRSPSVTPPGLVFSPDGRWLVGLFEWLRRGVTCWDLRAVDVQESQRSFDGHFRAEQAVFLDGGQRLITVDMKQELAEWVEWDASQLPDKLTPMRKTPIEGGLPGSRSWFSSNRRLVACDAGKQLAIWNLEKDLSKPAFHLMEQEGRIDSVAFSHDGRWLATSCRGKPGAFIRLWDMTSSDVSKSGILLPTPAGFDASDKGSLTVTSDDRFLIATNLANVVVWTLPIEEIYTMARSAAGRDLTADERVLYDVPSLDAAPSKVKRPLRPSLFHRGITLRPAPARPSRSEHELLTFREHRAGVSRVAVSPGGQLVASTVGSESRDLHRNEESQRWEWRDVLTQMAPEIPDQRILVWETATGKVVQTFSVGSERALDLAWSEDGAELRWFTRNGEVLARNARDGTTKTLSSVPAEELPVALFSHSLLTLRPNDRESDLLTLRLLASGEKLAVLTGKDWWPDSATINGPWRGLARRQLSELAMWPDSATSNGPWLVFHNAEAWNWKTNERVSWHNELRSQIMAAGDAIPMWPLEEPWASEMAPGGASVALVTSRGAFLFDWKQRKIERELPLPSGSTVGCLAWSPDGRWLAFSEVAAGKPLVGIYSMSEDKVLHSFTGHTAPIRDLEFTPDSRQVISASADSTVRVWRVTDAAKPLAP